MENLQNLSLQSISNMMAELGTLIDPNAEISVPEKIAEAAFEALRRTNEIETTTLIVRGLIIRKIRRHNLWSYLPNSYNTIEDAIEAETGLSRTQQSIAENLAEVVVPYLQQKYDNPMEILGQIPRSNIAEVMPVLRTLLTGEKSKSERVNRKARELAQEFGDPLAAADFVLETASQLPTAELRSMLRGETEPIQAIVYTRDEQTYLLARLTPDQVEALYRLSLFSITPLVDVDPQQIKIVRELINE